MSRLSDLKCVPCRGGVPPLTDERIAELQSQLGKDWQIVSGHHLTRTFHFKNFAQALEFTNRLGTLAEEQGHHPVIQLSWGKVVVDIRSTV